MKYWFTLLTICLWLFILGVSSFAKAWHNFSPLKTTRAEVLRSLGKPQYKQPKGGEYFKVGNQTVTIRWVRSNCSGQNSILDEQSAGSDALVYQITVTPEAPLASIELELLIEKDMSAPKSVYKKWLSQDMSCLIGGNGESSCTIWDGGAGLGYSTSKVGVVAIYYFPTDEEDKAWMQKYNPCRMEEDKAG